jgi:hypothetical protein
MATENVNLSRPKQKGRVLICKFELNPCHKSEHKSKVQFRTPQASEQKESSEQGSQTCIVQDNVKMTID